MQALPVSALVAFVKSVLEANDALWDLWIVGEVSNYSRSRLGHRYFTLKDENAVIACVLFRNDMPDAELRNGERVFAHGRVTVFEGRGQLQFICDFVRPEGVGLEAARLEELRRRLEREGLFDASRKRRPPRFPRRIGVVTSPTGAAIRDIERVLRHRWPLAELVLAPAFVQGDRAVPNLLAALQDLAGVEGLDVAIVARGGGATEDLAAFNDERIARAIYAFPVPVVTGLGHERDQTIADLVADVTAPTPSAAVERCTPDVREVWATIARLERAMRSDAAQIIARDLRAVRHAADRLRARAPRLEALASAVAHRARDLREQIQERCARERSAVEAAAARLEAMDPRAVLRRGYAVVERVDGRRRPVTSVRHVRGGDRLTVSVSDGAFWAEVR
jgi:exodeoxyribonuclease VII large subunit